MARKTYDRVKDSTTTTGAGTVTLAGSAPTGYRTLATAGMATGDTCAYAIVHTSANEWEVVVGTYNSTGPTLTRDKLRASSTGSSVSFSAGTKEVFLVAPAVEIGLDEQDTLPATAAQENYRKNTVVLTPSSSSTSLVIGDEMTINYAGTASLSLPGHLVGRLGRVQNVATGQTVALAIGVEGTIEQTDGTITTAAGVVGALNLNAAGKTIDSFTGVYGGCNSNAGTITNYYGVRTVAPTNTGAGSITNLYGTHFPDCSALPGIPANRYAFYNADPGARVYSAGPVCDSSFQFSTPSSGDTVTVASNVSTVMIYNVNAMDDLTIAMPSAPANGQRCTISTLSPIRVLNLTTGGTIFGALTDMSYGECVSYQYYLPSTLWFKVAAGSLPDGVSRGQVTALQLGMNLP